MNSTGKRRYGHPVLNGVLPEPWLPLKKDQALVNNEGMTSGNGHGRYQHQQRDQAVVLTLRKRYSVQTGGARARERSRQRQSALGRGGIGSSPLATVDSNAGFEIDPWQDASTSTTPRASKRTGTGLRPTTGGLSGTRALTHRLSYDHASGVIMLPDEDAWLDSEDSDIPVDSDVDGGDDDHEADSVEEDFGTEVTHRNRLGQTSAAGSILSGSPEGLNATLGTGTTQLPLGQGQSPADVSTGGVPPQTPSSQIQGSSQSQHLSTPGGSRVSRYGTYFHHPERRKQQQQSIPGAFPFPPFR